MMTVKCVTSNLNLKKKEYKCSGAGNGPIDSCKDALMSAGFGSFKLTHYSEHALDQGSSSNAIAYIQIENKAGNFVFGAGVDANITKSSIKALFCALNRG